MPVRKQDAYKALELLEEYYNRLDTPEDKPLKNAIDRVIKVFKSRLFQALIDIQEFYESILLDEQSDRQTKMNATLQLAEEWERQPMLKRGDHQRNGTPDSTLGGGGQQQTRSSGAATVSSLTTATPVLPATATNKRPPQQQQPMPTPSFLPPSADHFNEAAPSHPPHGPTATGTPLDINQFSYIDHWRDEEIFLERPPGEGLGFSIAGGIDTPCIDDSPAVVVTRITEGGLAYKDKRLKLHDIILRVNDIDFTQIVHQTAVNALKAAGPEVRLIIRRLAPPVMEEIRLERPPNTHLGFSIAGGISHEHVKGDHGLFITNIIPNGIAAQNGRLRVGDRLMSVQSEKTTYELEFVEHKHAVESIRRACDEGQTITLVVGHPTFDQQENDEQPFLPPPPEAQQHLHPAPHTNGHRTPIPHHQLQQHGKAGAGIDDEHDYKTTAERRVFLRRGNPPNSGFGFNIVGGDADEGIFISLVQPGGAADQSGNLRRGDRILSVNGTDLRGASHEEAAQVLKSCGDAADMVVVHRMEDFLRFESKIHEMRDTMMGGGAGSTGSLKTSTKRHFYVRAEFDYDPSKDPGLPGDRGLPFRAGDILHVTNAADDSWWQARRVTGNAEEEELGIIPSKSRVEKKERTRQKKVNFNSGGGGAGSRSSTLDREKGSKKKKKFGLFGKGGGKDAAEQQSGDDSDNEPGDSVEPVNSYERVSLHEVNHTRPVIMFGPFKELLTDQLMADHPDKFANCVPHTSRPRREKEVDGREYYFVKDREQMQRDIKNHLFIEAGEYGGNLYGTSVDAVREVAATSKHCILDVSGLAIQRLITAGIYPISIFVKPRDVNWILDNMGPEANEERARMLFEKANKIGEQFGDLFTAIVEEETLSDVYERICEIVDREQDQEKVWVPSKEKL